VFADTIASSAKLAVRVDEPKTFTAEQIVESSILLYGSRPVLDHIRHYGLERGKITRFTPDGKTGKQTMNGVL